jgi:hypothetical protein
MIRLVCGSALLGLFVVTSGCSMCAHPFDYYGPVWNGCNSDPLVRAGSVLDPGGMGPSPMMAPEIAPGDVVSSEGGEMPYDEEGLIDEAAEPAAPQASPSPNDLMPEGEASSPETWTPATP